MAKVGDFRAGRHCVFKNYVHLVFITKYRRDVLTKQMLDRLKELLAETCLQMDCQLLEFNGEDDYVHLIVAVHPKLAVSNLVGKLKGKSSYFLRQEFWPQLKEKLWGKHLWSPSYCVVSCSFSPVGRSDRGGAPLEIIRKY